MQALKKGCYLGQPFNFTLPSVSTLTDMLGPGAWLWTADLARVHRQVRLCPLSTLLLGISVHDSIYLDIAHPFGCRTSALSTSLRMQDISSHLCSYNQGSCLAPHEGGFFRPLLLGRFCRGAKLTGERGVGI